MSVNYHAYQSRGVLFEEYEVVCQQWREEFSEYKRGGLPGSCIWKRMRTICI